MNKTLSSILSLFLLGTSLVYGQGSIEGVYDEAASGSTSATVFVKPTSAFANITDLSWRLDVGVTTGQIICRPGDVKYTSTSATSASGSTVWFANTGTGVSSGSYIIILDESAGTYFLRQVGAATTTSVTVSEAITPALTTSDIIWSVLGSYSRPVPQANSASAAVNLWFPKNVPTSITVDGNTTSCRISVSGVRSNYR